jgi:HK97 family phage portal protein
VPKVEIKAGEPRYTLVKRDTGRETIHDASDVLHIKGLSIDGLRGVSPIRQCAEALGLADALQKQASAYATNGAVPRGVLMVSAGTAQGDIMENLEKVWRDAVQFSPLSIPPSDSEFVPQRRLSTSEIARIFRVPASLIGAESGSSLTYTNSEMESLHLLRHSLQPLPTSIEQSISADRTARQGFSLALR